MPLLSKTVFETPPILVFLYVFTGCVGIGRFRFHRGARGHKPECDVCFIPDKPRGLCCLVGFGVGPQTVCTKVMS